MWTGFNQEFGDQTNVIRFLTTGDKLKWTTQPTTTSTTTPKRTRQPTTTPTTTPTPTTPQKDKEKMTDIASEGIASNFLIKQMMQNPEMLQEYLNYLQKQNKKEETDKIDESAGSSESTFDPFGGPCGQDPNDF